MQYTVGISYIIPSVPTNAMQLPYNYTVYTCTGTRYEYRTVRVPGTWYRYRYLGPYIIFSIFSSTCTCTVYTCIYLVPLKGNYRRDWARAFEATSHAEIRSTEYASLA